MSLRGRILTKQQAMHIFNLTKHLRWQQKSRVKRDMVSRLAQQYNVSVKCIRDIMNLTTWRRANWRQDAVHTDMHCPCQATDFNV